jgi:hypothetical protein
MYNKKEKKKEYGESNVITVMLPEILGRPDHETMSYRKPY